LHWRSSQAAFHRLRQRFLSWQSTETRLLEDVQLTPRLSDAAVRAGQLGELAGVGLSSLAYLESHTAPAEGWQAQQMSILNAAAQPSALAQAGVGCRTNRPGELSDLSSTRNSFKAPAFGESVENG
jgi:hypothetical protein